MSLLDRRVLFKPFEYEPAYKYWEKQQQAHWLHHEIPMSKDIQDWNERLTDAEKNVIGNVLKGFTQTEPFVNEYWARKVGKWFPKPEIALMASAFSAMEGIHTKAYSYLDESLGLDNYEGFMNEPTTAAKIQRLDAMLEAASEEPEDIAKSLATFSAFTEGVSLFSAFAILMHYSKFNKLPGVGQIVAFSVRDESLHSEAGCWLFRTFIKEFPDIWTPELKSEIHAAAQLTVELEDNFINKAFELGPINDLDPADLKDFIRFRTDTKLHDLGLKSMFDVDAPSIRKRFEWFDFLTTGVEHQDFFANRVSTYSKGTGNWDPSYVFTSAS